MVKRYAELCAETKHALAAEGDMAAPIARELVAFAAERTVEDLLRDQDRYATDRAMERLQTALRDYLNEKPLAYILGEWSFYGLPLFVTEDVLIPRDDSMVCAEMAIEKAKAFAQPRALDLCTGSGCIGLAVAAKVPSARVTLADLSDAALAIAKKNIGRNDLHARVSAVKVDVLQPAPTFLREYDVICANPPYVTRAEMQSLPRSVADYEPHLALFGGEDGLDFYRAICKNFRGVLRVGGWLCMEFGQGQEGGVEAILREYQFENLWFCKDTSHIIRAVAAQKTERN